MGGGRLQARVEKEAQTLIGGSFVDSTRFDAFVRGLSITANRRRVFGAFAVAVPAAVLRHIPAAAIPLESCRWNSLPCRRNHDCCDGAQCLGGTCSCKTGYVQCGDICMDKQQADANACCKPYKTKCSWTDAVSCCTACTGRLNGKRVCCGLEVHPCSPENEAYCCSGRCGSNGRCTPW